MINDFGITRTKIKKPETSHADALQTSAVDSVKWMSPESLTLKVFSTQSDVFSFGVTMYEIITREDPWSGLDNLNAIYKVINGVRMEIGKEHYCSDEIKALMNRCWSEDPDDRPNFGEICDELNLIIKGTSSNSEYSVRFDV